MSYLARVYNVMIASPGDVPQERNAFVEAVHDWNVIHAEHRKLVLLPLRWETHAVPASGAHPQEVINKQLVQGCDLMVAVFGNRMGTPTPNAVSGTVEEIELHERAGRRVMLYFSDADIPRNLDEKQRAQLEEVEAYRQKRKDDAFYNTYTSSSDFQTKFARHLSKVLNDKMFQGAETSDSKPVPSLTEAAFELLNSACLNGSGQIMAIRTGLLGRHISTQERDFSPSEDNAREFAKWEGAVVELEKRGFIQDQGRQGDIYLVTEAGWQLVEDRSIQDSDSDQ